MQSIKHEKIKCCVSPEKKPKKYENLESEDYAHKFKMYFRCVTYLNQTILEDFSYILTG